MMMNDRKETLYRVFRTTLGIDRVDDTLSQRNCERWDSLALRNKGCKSSICEIYTLFYTQECKIGCFCIF